MAGKFVLRQGSSGKFHFNLLVGDGQVIATSETYESKQSDERNRLRQGARRGRGRR